MKLVVALGNPGSEYAQTRHNTGWIFIDEYLENIKWKEQKNALIYKNNDIIFVKPQKFYNLTGEIVQQLARFYKIESKNILAIHDDLSLPVGSIRTRFGGSSAGNNGIENLIANIGGDFARIRIGIAGDYSDAKNFVLSKFTKSELETLTNLQPKINQFIDDFINDKFDHTTHKNDREVI